MPMPQDQISELQERIKSLETRQSQLLGLLGSTPDSVLGMDTEGMVTAWNPGAERILGWSKEEAMGRRMSELIIPPKYREAHENGMRRYLKTGEARVLNRVVEIEALHKDGHTMPIELSIWPISDDKGQGFGAFVRDVSERHRSQESLRNSEERYRSVVEHLGEGMFVAQNNRVVFSNAQASQILQVPTEKLFGSDPVEWILLEDRHVLLDLRERLQKRLLTQDQYEVRHLGQDGVVRWLNIRPKPVAWDGGIATLTFFSDVTERKSILEALKRSEERYRAVIENVDSGMVVLQGDHLVYANRRAAEIARMNPDDLLKVGFLHHVHPDDHAVILDRRARRLKGEDVPRSYEVRLQFPDGTLTWIEIGVSVIPWDGMPATITFFSDVTERKKMTHALHLSEERYRAVVEHSGEGMVVVHDNKFVFVNKRAAELVQMSVEDMLREGYLHRIHPDDKALVDERRRKRLAGDNVPSRYEIRMLLPGNVVRWFDIGITVVPWDGKQASLTFFSDVTERKASEDELQRTSSEREAILQSALVGIVLSINRHTQWCNDKFAEMLGVSRESLIGQSSVHMHPDPALWEAYGVVQRAALAEHGTFSHQRQLKRSNGELFWVQMAGRCVRDRDPDSGVIWTFLDITDRIQAEQKTLEALEQQKELNELRSRFVAMTSHEFRTPLATILSSAELLKYYSERMPAAEKVEVIQTIENSVHRMTRMLDRVLLLGKADAQMLEFRPGELDLLALCNSVVEEVRNQHPDTRCDIVFAFDDTCRSGQYDDKLLRHIFANLLSNAVKYSPNGGVVRFTVAPSGGRVQFTVSDEGIGIPAEEIPHLFESFHRASNVGDIQGTGLGLAIVKNSVELHGGTIDVYSVAGEGTRFVVEL
ncbi:MAG: PAS domain S-box protein [Rhodoferax sp.]|nr:PAS domain S-box protein [Rhodoferax sp.]